MEVERDYRFAHLTTDELAGLIGTGRTVVVLVPVGSVEPHGPHLPLITDTVISEAAALRAAAILDTKGVVPFVAPGIAYGVTNCAAAFKGAVSIDPGTLTALLRDVITGLLDDGVFHVCLVNNHLEPGHDAAVRAAAENLDPHRVSVATPLKKRWARILSDEFKSGACHAGEYETAIVMTANPRLVRDDVRETLPEVPISLSAKLKAGIADFREMGLGRAYAGAPAAATPEHGAEQLEKLAAMITTEVLEAIGRSG